MGFIQKQKVERKVNPNVGKHIRNVPALAMISTMVDEVLRNKFTMSNDYMEKLALLTNSAVLFDDPLALVVVTEGSELATMFYAKKREAAKNKSNEFGSPELVKALIDKGLIKGDRVAGDKVIFGLTEFAADSDEVSKVLADAGEFAKDIKSVWGITVIEETKFVPRPHTKGDDATETATPETGDGSVVPAAAFTPSESSAETAEPELVNANGLQD